MGTDEKIFLDLTARIYDAAVDPSLWDNAIGGEAGIIFHFDRRPIAHGMGRVAANAADLVARVGYDDQTIQSYENHFAVLDVRAPILLAKPAGSLFSDDRDISFASVKKSEIYSDFYLPLRAGGHGIAMNLFGEEQRFGCLSVHKPTGAVLSPGDIALFEALAPHVVRALQLMHHTEALKFLRSAENQALGAMGVGLILTDRAGRIVFANRVAEDMLRAGDALTVSGGILRASDPAHRAALAGAIAQTVDLAAGKSVLPGGSLRLARDSGAGCCPTDSTRRRAELARLPDARQ